MSKQVFIFESDTGFAGEVEQALAPLGVAVTVLTDPDLGLGLVIKSQPDLVLLSVELQKGNGFSVCNKLKREETVKAIPVIILSTTATDETFRQHKSLRTRANAYLHKPITTRELLRQMQAFLPVDVPGSGEDELGIPESVALESSDLVSVESSNHASNGAAVSELGAAPGGVTHDVLRVRSHGPVPAIVDEQAELTDEDIVVSGSVPPTARALGVPSEGDGGDADMSVDADLSIEHPLSDVIALDDEEELHISIPPEDSAPHAVETDGPRLGGTVTRFSQSPPKSDEELRQDELLLAKEQEIKRLRREIERFKATPQTSASGQAREFLDLRERLNKKDKELLEQREQLNERDKELLGLRDSVIDFERKAADHAEKNLELERQLAEAAKGLEAALADKEQANKRSEDYKRKLDKVKAEFDTKAAELVKFREESARATKDAVLRAEAAGRAELERGLLAAEEARAVLFAQALEKARVEQAAAHGAEVDRRSREFESERAARQVAEDEMLAKVRAGYELAAEERTRAQEGAHRLELEGQKGALESLNRAVNEDRQRRHAVELAEQAAATEAALFEVGRLRENVDALEAKHQSLEATTRELHTDLTGVMATLEGKERLLENARALMAQDRVSFQETKEALLEAVRVLESGERRFLD